MAIPSIQDLENRIIRLENLLRITPEPRKAREFWMHMDERGYPEKVVDNSATCHRCVLFREVLRDVMPE